MKAMVLAAGLGKRMRPLTLKTPKPLLALGGQTLIDWHLQRLVAAGISDIVVNVAYLGRQIERHLGDGSRYGARISISDEGDQPLETGGGVRRALPLLGEQPFLLVNADIWTDYPFALLSGRELDTEQLAYLVLVGNPPHHPDGDFTLDNGRLSREGKGSRLTYSGISLLSPRLFEDQQDQTFPLLACLLPAMKAGRVGGEHFCGQWDDIGTPQRLAALEAKVGIPQKIG